MYNFEKGDEAIILGVESNYGINSNFKVIGNIVTIELNKEQTFKDVHVKDVIKVSMIVCGKKITQYISEICIEPINSFIIKGK